MIKANRVKSIIARFEIEFENGDEDPIKRTAAARVEWKDDMTPNKTLALKGVKVLTEAFEDFFNENVEENS